MRDIRNDLQERAAMIGEHIKATQAQFETALEQIKRDHDGRTKDLRAELEAVKAMLGIEQRRHDTAPQAVPQPHAMPQPLAQAGKSPRPLSGILMRRAG
jgi:predicted metal-dependent phosphoesterase TrpH